MVAANLGYNSRMPAPKNPNASDFYVYCIEANGRVFYVGHGRSKRAAYRVSYMKTQIKREAEGKVPHWNLHTRVMRCLHEKGIDSYVWYKKWALTKEEATQEEAVQIGRLRSIGAILANCQHNEGGPPEESIIQFVLFGTVSQASGRLP